METHRKKSKSLWRYTHTDQNGRLHPQSICTPGRYKRGKFTIPQWDELCLKYGMRCACCGKPKGPGQPLCADHIIPIRRGGSTNIDNIQPLCVTCNLKKGWSHSTRYTAFLIEQPPAATDSVAEPTAAVAVRDESVRSRLEAHRGALGMSA